MLIFAKSAVGVWKSNGKVNVGGDAQDPAGFRDGMNLYQAYFDVNGVDPDGLALYAFDGTDNDRTRMKNPTNVALLADKYQDGEVFYIKGVGTDWWSMIPGGLFGAGAGSRLEKAYQALLINYKNRDEIIDIVGFSRGAAEAREFSNMIAERGVVSADGVKTIPRIRFLGLFDTVGSFGIPGNSVDIGIRMSIPGIVDKVRHATAEDEVRNLFPLTSIMRPGEFDMTGRLIEASFPGVHSDVGGGYDDDNEASYAPLRWMWQQMHDGGVRMGDLGERYKETYGPFKYHDSRYFTDKMQAGWSSMWGETYERKKYYQE